MAGVGGLKGVIFYLRWTVWCEQVRLRLFDIYSLSSDGSVACLGIRDALVSSGLFILVVVVK